MNGNSLGRIYILLWEPANEITAFGVIFRALIKQVKLKLYSVNFTCKFIILN